MATRPHINVSDTTRTGADRTLLLIVASNRRRGAEVFGQRLTEGFESRGWGVSFVALTSPAGDRTVDADPLTNAENLGRLDMGTLEALRRRIASDRPSAILANGGATLRYAAAAHALTTPRRRPVFAYSSIGEPRYWLRSPRHKRLQRFLHRRPSLIFAVSRMTRDQLVSDLDVSPRRVHVAPTGVSSEFFIEQAAPHDELRVLFLGNLSHEKNPMAALDSVDRATGEIQLRFVGDGPEASTVEHEVERRQMRDIVSFTGSVDDVVPHLEWADLLILPSRTEGLPGASLEAGAAGVPTVAFDVGGTRETMIPGSTGIVVAPGDIDALADELSHLADDRDRLSSMGASARTFVRNNYSLEDAVAEYERVLALAVDRSVAS